MTLLRSLFLLSALLRTQLAAYRCVICQCVKTVARRVKSMLKAKHSLIVVKAVARRVQSMLKVKHSLIVVKEVMRLL